MFPILPVPTLQTPLTILENNNVLASKAKGVARTAARLYTLLKPKEATQTISWDALVAGHKAQDDFWHASIAFAESFHFTLLSSETNPTIEKTQSYVKAAMEMISSVFIEQQLPPAYRSDYSREVIQEICTQEVKHFAEQQPLRQITLESLIAEMIRLQRVFPDSKPYVLFESLCKAFFDRRLSYQGNQFAWSQREELDTEGIEEAVLEEQARLQAQKQELLVTRIDRDVFHSKSMDIEERLKEIDAQNNCSVIREIILNDMNRRIELLDAFRLGLSGCSITHAQTALEHLLGRLGLTVAAVEELSRVVALRSERTQEIRDLLDQWVTQGVRGERREIARWRILSFLADEQQNMLNLNGLGLTIFPPIFGPLFQRLKCLDLGNNADDPSRSNALVMVPEWIGQLENLEIFKLSGAYTLTSLPESMKQLHKLKNFTYTGSRLSPDSLSDIIGELKSLENLTLIICELTSIPKSIFQLKNLKHLNLSANLLRSFPEELCSLVNLFELNLSNNRIESIPETICHLQQLKILNLQDNELESVPLEITKLSPKCQIDLRDNEIPSAIHRQINAIQELDQWVAEGSPEENRELVRKRIQAFLADEQKDKLDFFSLQLKTFPSIFDHPVVIERLKSLNLRTNSCVKLPESISQLENLERLYLQGPISLPTSIQKLQKLKILSSAYTPISAEFFSGVICKLKNLENLYLRGCELESIPEAISRLVNLEVLDLSENQIDSFPKELCSLVNLEVLRLNENTMNWIPETISHLRKLKLLELKHNGLRGLPLEIMRLSPQCVVDLQGSHFLLAVCKQIDAIMKRVSLDSIPQIIGIEKGVPDASGKPSLLQTLAHDLFAAAWLPVQQFPTLLHSDNQKVMRDWLSRLLKTADYNPSGIPNYLTKVELTRSFARSVIEAMKEAEDNPAFQKVFLRIIGNMTASCEDSITLSCVHVRLQYRLITLSPHDVQGLAHLLIKGEWALQMIENFANYKIAALKHAKIEHDPIQEHLGYIMGLKDPLKLPIDVKEMMYASNVEKEDLEIAEEFILKKQENPNEVCSFLIDEEHWGAMLKTRYKDRYEAVEKDVNDISMDSCVTDADYRQVEEKRIALRIALTRDILKETKAAADSEKGKEPAT